VKETLFVFLETVPSILGMIGIFSLILKHMKKALSSYCDTLRGRVYKMLGKSCV